MWNDLTMSERADVIKMAVKAGLRDMKSIRDFYDKSLSGNSYKYADGGPKVTYGKPYYSYDKNMQIETDSGKPILNYSATLPEVNIIPDSKKSPADRNEARRFREKIFSDNAEREARDYTQRQIMKSQRDWDNSLEKKALGYAQDALTGVGIGADIVSGLPIYSSLKGTRVLSEANSLPEYIEGGLWLAPIGGVVGKEAYNVGKNAWNTSKNTIPSALEYAYNRDKRLSKIGTINDYEEYIKTVFPQSSVKDIQYHMGPKGLTELKPSTGEIWNTNPNARGIYVTPERSYIEAIRKFTTDRLEKPSALTYIKRNLTPNGWKEANEQFTDIYPLLIDTRNPMRTRGNWTWGMKDKKYQEVMNQYDAIINSGPRWWQNVNKMPETIVPKSSQVHILGTDADVEGFRNFMSSKATNKKAEGGSIHIAPSKRGTFTAAATKHGMGVQEFASKVLANKDNYSSTMVKKANFARNFGGHKHDLGGYLFEEGGPKNTNREYKSANSWSTANVGKTLAPILEPISRKIMNAGEQYAFPDATQIDASKSTAQDTYLLPRNVQRAVFLNRGYQTAPKDYGLVEKAVNRRNIPVYQRAPDDISRNEVVPMLNVMAEDTIYDVENWFGKPKAKLEDPGNFPTTFYLSTDGKKIYQKGWDLNDYGDGADTWYKDSKARQLAAKGIDLIGSPTVVTTGISEVGNLTDLYREYPELVEDILASKGLVPLFNVNAEEKPLYTKDGELIGVTHKSGYVPSLPEVTITGKRRKKVK